MCRIDLSKWVKNQDRNDTKREPRRMRLEKPVRQKRTLRDHRNAETDLSLASYSKR